MILINKYTRRKIYHNNYSILQEWLPYRIVTGFFLNIDYKNGTHTLYGYHLYQYGFHFYTILEQFLQNMCHYGNRSHTTMVTSTIYYGNGYLNIMVIFHFDMEPVTIMGFISICTQEPFHVVMGFITFTIIIESILVVIEFFPKL